MGPHNYVSTEVRCRTHGKSAQLCVPVDTEVPLPLRCPPGGGSGGVTLGSLGPCSCISEIENSELVRRVRDALRGGIGEWIRNKAVVIEC
jgi:hypothetical protein